MNTQRSNWNEEGWRRLQWTAKEFNDLRTDEARYSYIMSHPDKFMLLLDNDYTMVDWSTQVRMAFQDVHEDDFPELVSMDNYLGWSEGVFDLLSLVGIEAESI